MIKNREQRVGIFIDIQNLYHSSKNLYSARVNYKELMDTLVADRKLVRAIGYVVKTESTLGESSFFDALVKSGIDLRMKDIQIFPDGMKKADWDVGLAIDAVRLSNALDVVVLVTGDGDFVPLVEYLRWGLGKTVEVAAFGRSASSKLKESADEFINMDELNKVVMRRPDIFNSRNNNNQNQSFDRFPRRTSSLRNEEGDLSFAKSKYREDISRLSRDDEEYVRKIETGEASQDAGNKKKPARRIRGKSALTEKKSEAKNPIRTRKKINEDKKTNESYLNERNN